MDKNQQEQKLLDSYFENELAKKKNQDESVKIVKSMSLYSDSIEIFRDIVETHKVHQDFRKSFADVFRELVEKEKERLKKVYGKLEKAPTPKAGRR